MIQQSGLRSNVEIKAHCHDPAALRLLALELGAEFIREERQRDTYFRVPEGRLKLRFIEVESGNRSELIRYYRTNRPEPCVSHYSIKPVRLPWLRRWWLSLRHGLLVEVARLTPLTDQLQHVAQLEHDVYFFFDRQQR